MRYIAYFLLAMLLIVGAIACMRRIVWLFMRPLKNSETVIKLYFDEKTEDAEFSLRAAISQLKWIYSPNGRVCILCVDRGMQQETREICELFCQRYPSIQIVEAKKENDDCQMDCMK